MRKDRRRKGRTRIMERTVSPVWNYFTLVDGDESKAVCGFCPLTLEFSTTSSLINHLSKKHAACLDDEFFQDTAAESEEEEIKQRAGKRRNTSEVEKCFEDREEDSKARCDLCQKSLSYETITPDCLESEARCNACKNIEPHKGSSFDLKRHLKSVSSSSLDQSDDEESKSPRPGKKGSVLWVHFDNLKNHIASCKYCNKCISYKSTTANLKTHLKRKHPIIIDVGMNVKSELEETRAQLPNRCPQADPLAIEEVSVTLKQPEIQRRKILQSSRLGKKSSMLWTHFDTLENFMASCNYCKNLFSYKSTITNLLGHLKRKHPKIFDVGIDVNNELASRAQEQPDRCPQTERPEAKEPDATQSGKILAASRPERRSSVVWAHFDSLENHMASCKHCNNSISYKSTTTNLMTHLKRKHPKIDICINVKDILGASRAQEQLQDKRPHAEELAVTHEELTVTHEKLAVTPEQLTVTHEKLAVTPQQLDSQNEKILLSPGSFSHSPVPPKNKVKLTAYTPKSSLAHVKKVLIENAMLKLFVWDFQPFTIIKDRGFRELISAFAPAFVIPDEKHFSDSLLPPIFDSCRANSLKIIQSAETLCLTTDLWTSVTNDTFIAVSAHYISPDYTFKTILLECVPLLGSSCTATMTKELQRLAQEWDLKERVLMVVTDGEHNVKRSILESFGWRHFSCYAHTLNTVIEDSLTQVEQLLKRVKTIVAYFVTSPMATQTLANVQMKSGVLKPMCLIQDVPTRWITTYYMLKRFSEIRESVSQALSLSDTCIAALDPTDLEACISICEILSPFEEICITMSQNQTFTASQVIPVSRGLKKTMMRLLSSNAYKDEVGEVLKKLQTGLNEKFPNLEQDDIFAMCMFLDPRFKHYYESKEAASNTKQIVIALVASILAGKERQSTTASTSNKRETLVRKISIWEEFDEVTDNIVKPADALNNLASLEVEQYMREDVLPRDKSPLDWWKFHEHLYPNLSHLVKLKFCVTGTCVPSNVLFSEEGYILLERRKRLNSTKINQLMFLNINY